MENINEIISKSRLLFGYDPKKTLTENIDSTELKEGGKGMINALDDLARGGKTAATELANITNQALKHMPGGEIKLLVTNSKGQLVSKVINTGDDFAKAMKGGAKFADNTVAQNFSKSLMKTPLPPNSKLRQTLTDKAADLATKSDEYKNLSKKDIERLLKKKKYHPDVAAEIAQKADDIRGGSKKKFKTPEPDPNKPNTPEPNKPNTPDPKTDPKNLTNKDLEGIKSILGKHWEYIKEMYKQGKKLAMIRKWAVRLGLSLGAIYLLWKWLSDQDGTDKCPVGTVFDGTQCVPIPPIPVTCPSGTVWNGSSCVRKGGGGGGTTYENCTDFPYKKGCQSSIIAEVQKCLGITADGKFGNGTLNALRSGGYGDLITKEVYDKIKSKCGGNTNDNTTITTTSDIIKIQSGDSIEW